MSKTLDSPASVGLEDNLLAQKDFKSQCGICSENVAVEFLKINEEKLSWGCEMKPLVYQFFNINADANDDDLLICPTCRNLIREMKIQMDRKELIQRQFDGLKSLLTDRAQYALKNCVQQCEVNKSVFNLALLAECGSDVHRKALQYRIIQGMIQDIGHEQNKHPCSYEFDEKQRQNGSSHFRLDDLCDIVKPAGRNSRNFEVLGMGMLEPALDYCSVKKAPKRCLSKKLSNNHRKNTRPTVQTVQRPPRGFISNKVKGYLFNGEYVCKQCPTKLKGGYSFYQHLLIHEGKAPTCTTCGKSFARMCSLKIHMRCHTGDKPYGCHQCEKKYRDAATLQIHLRNHTGERPYKCTVCGKGFTSRCRLNDHTSIHKGIKNFKCTFCTEDFRTNHQLKIHQRVQHKEQGFPKLQCEVCCIEYTSYSGLVKHRKMKHN